ncbi:MAG: hypothetical protein ABIR68_01515 [Ilumatobacteraceae bacterium]
MARVSPAARLRDTTLDLHEWVSFEADVEQRTWVFDATFLRSNWSCIFGQGCKGVLDDDATDLVQGCCSYGAHFVDDDDVAAVVASAARLTPAQWQFHRRAKRGGFLASDDGATTTRLVDGACIFLNRPGFPAGPGCALHTAALDIGERPLDWKPDVCWQLPLRLDNSTDDHGYVTSTLREWKRRDWGPGGEEFHWWCTASDEAFVGADPTYRYLRDEIIEMVGETVYARLVALLERPRWTPLPHPAVRG